MISQYIENHDDRWEHLIEDCLWEYILVLSYHCSLCANKEDFIIIHPKNEITC